MRPSELLNVVALHGEWVAFCFDQAVFYLGSYIEGELDNIKQSKGKNADKANAAKRERLLRKLLGEESQAGKRFADPAGFFK